MTTTRRQHPRRTARSLAGAALVCALVAAQALASFHFVVVPHTVCPEHGESIHGAAPGGHDHDAEQRGADGAWHVGGVPPKDAHDHDHCTFAVEVRSWLTRAPARTCVLPPVVAAVRHPAARDAVAHCGLDLTLLAPKTSPPV